MAFVRGHWRALGWVRSHRRSPDRPAEGQLALPAPAARPAAAAAAPATASAAMAATARPVAGSVVIPAQRGAEVPVSAARR